MKNFFKQLSIAIILMLCVTSIAHAVSIFQVQQGGTGVGTLSGIVQGNGTSPFTALSTTGSGSVVLNNSPSLVTPTIGAATATSINGLTISTSTGTLTVANGKTLTANNSLAFTGTDGTTFTFPGSSDTVVTLGATQTLTNKTLTTPSISSPVITGGLIDASSAASTLKLKSNTAAALQITDGTNAYQTIDTRTTNSGSSAFTFTQTAPTIASAAGAQYISVTHTPGTYNFTGTTNQTGTGTASSLGSLFNQPTISSNGTHTITETSNVLVNGPTVSTSSSGTQTITNAYGLNILAGSSLAGSGGAVTNGYGLSVNAPTGAGTNYAAIFQGGNVGIGTTNPGSLFTIEKDALATTDTFGSVLQNLTAATSGATVQQSPAQEYCGNVWNTSGTPATNTNCMWWENVPTSGTAPLGVMKLGFSNNGGATTYPLTVDGNGNITNKGSITMATNGVLSGSGTIGLQFLNSPNANGTFQISGNINNNTSGGNTVWNDAQGWSPSSGSGSVAMMQINPTFNATSTGTAYALAIASKTNVVTGGKIRLLSVGTTTTDVYTGYTEEFGIDASGNVSGSGSLSFPTAGTTNLGTSSGTVNVGDSTFTPTSFYLSNGQISLSSSGTNVLIGHTNIGVATGITFDTDNTYNIGASGANRPANVYVGTSVVSPAINATTGFQVNGAATSGNILQGNGTNFVSVAGNGVQKYLHTIFTPTTGNTVSLVDNQYNIINPAGALLAVTLNLPSTPSNNDVVYIKFTQNITTVTYANGTVVDGITAPTAGGLTVLTYDSATTSWY